MGFLSPRKKKGAFRQRQKKPPLLPAAVQGFLARRLADAMAVSLCAAGAALGLAFASYDPRDPSFNTKGAALETHNLLGAGGAYAADVLLQTLGLAAWVFALAFLVWGGRLLARLPLTGPRARFPLLLAAAVAASAALARIPAAEGFTAGRGGGLGDILLRGGGGALQGWTGGSVFLLVPLAAAILAAVALVPALGISRGEWMAGIARAREALAAALFQARRGSAFCLAWYDQYKSSGLPEDGREAPARRLRVSLSEDAPQDIEPAKKPVVTPRGDARKPPPERQQKFDLRAEGEGWELPPLDLLGAAPLSAGARLDEAALQKNAELLHATLNDFGVQGEIVKVSPGPIVTLYEMEPAPGTKTSRVIGLADDIARSMSAVSVRVAVVPGKNAIGMELPNAKRETVYLRELLETPEYEKTAARLPLVLGKNIAGHPVIADLARMPHLLVAGTTGSGKSVAVNTMILSLVCRLSPEQCRFIMIDPKMLELSVYDDIPHLLTPVVTEPHRAVTALKWAVREMEDRYRVMSKTGVRNIDGFNERIRAARAKGEVLTHKVQTGFDADTGRPVYEEQPIPLNELPWIVVVVDEFADLMLVAGKEVENAIQRLAQMARAAGIHLIMATQRPSVDVITGVIKANFPTRISFQVTSRIDSRTILGDGGAEQLLGQGDMLYMAAGGRIQRVHGPFVSDAEVEKVAGFLRKQGQPDYIDGVTEDEEGGVFGEGGEQGGEADALYDQAVAVVLRERKASTSFIQRHLQIGYNRAARLIERMEKEGVVTPANHVGKREVLAGEYGT